MRFAPRSLDAQNRRRTPLSTMVIRPLEPDDADELTALRLRNRAKLEPWELDADDPDRWYTVDGVRAWITDGEVRFAIVDAGELAGMLSLTGIDRGPIQTAMVSYFVDEARSGRGLATRAVADAVRARVRRARPASGRSRYRGCEHRLAARARAQPLHARRDTAPASPDSRGVDRPLALGTPRRRLVAVDPHDTGTAGRLLAADAGRHATASPSRLSQPMDRAGGLDDRRGDRRWSRCRIRSTSSPDRRRSSGCSGSPRSCRCSSCLSSEERSPTRSIAVSCCSAPSWAWPSSPRSSS